MPRNDDYYDDDEQFDYGSLPPDTQRDFLYELIGFNENARDSEVRSLFWDVMYNDELSIGERLSAYDQLVDYLWNEYGMSFGDLWDWESFRQWYETA